MKCSEFENRLHAEFGPPPLKADENGATELAEHAANCAACRAISERFRLLTDGIGAWRAQVPEIDLVSSVIAAHQIQTVGLDSLAVDGAAISSIAPSVDLFRQTERPMPLTGIVARPLIFPESGWSRRRHSMNPSPNRHPKPTLRRLLSVGAACLFACVLIATVLVFRQNEDPPIAATKAMPTARERHPSLTLIPERRPSSHPDLQIRVPLHEVPRAAYYDLAQKAAGALGEVSIFVIPRATPSPDPDPATSENAGWIDGLRLQLKPVGRSLGDAFDFLWQAGQSADKSHT